MTSAPELSNPEASTPLSI